MEQKTLHADARTELRTAASRRLRRNGKIPAVIYGHREPRAVTIDEIEFHKQFRVISESQIIRVTVDGDDYEVLVKDYQEDILTGKLKHIDFYEIEQGKLLRTRIAVHLEGSPIGVREGGIQEQQLHELEIECLPTDIPQGINVDVENLDVGDSIHVAELTLPDSVTVLTNPDQVVVLIATARVEVEEVAEEEEEGEEGEEGEEREEDKETPQEGSEKE